MSQYTVCDCSAVGRTLAVADEQRVVHIWDTATGRELCTCPTRGGRVGSLALSPDGSGLVSLTDHVLQRWDLATGKPVYSVEGEDKYRDARLSADGKTLAVIEPWQAICFLDPVTGREFGRTKDPYSFATGFVLSGDGKTMVTTEPHSGAVCLWDVAAGPRKTVPAGHWSSPYGTSFSPDGRRLATGGSGDGTIHVWDLASAESVARIHRPGMSVRDCAFSWDGRSLFSAWADDNLWVCDAACGERRLILKLADPDRLDSRQSGISMHLSDDGRTLVAFSLYYPLKGTGRSYEDTLVTGWDASARRQLFQRRISGEQVIHALSPDTRVLALPHPADPPDDIRGKGSTPGSPGWHLRLTDVSSSPA
jgi:WD40 repeat protein